MDFKTSQKIFSVPRMRRYLNSCILGHIYEISMIEKQNITNKSVFLPKNLVNWNKYITFAA